MNLELFIYLLYGWDGLEHFHSSIGERKFWEDNRNPDDRKGLPWPQVLPCITEDINYFLKDSRCSPETPLNKLLVFNRDLMLVVRADDDFLKVDRRNGPSAEQMTVLYGDLYRAKAEDLCLMCDSLIDEMTKCSIWQCVQRTGNLLYPKVRACISADGHLAVSGRNRSGRVRAYKLYSLYSAHSLLGQQHYQ